ncbi:MAG TPA: SAM-dependent methyltransferase [Methanobacterium sp.]|nr:SAM-dependent methyltransferase [Methanobacterium sp.]
MLTSQLINYLLILVLIIIIIVFWFFWSDIIGAGFEPTSTRRVKLMLQIAQVKPYDVVYDLGSGDGRIVTMAARTYNACSVGIEADPLRVGWSRLTVFLLGCRDKVKIIWGNFFKVDISQATVVTLFLSAKANHKLKKKLETELKPGTRVVSYYWRIKGWEVAREDKENHIYLYIIGQTHYGYKQ